MGGPGPADERRHPPGAEPDWEEWWTFEAAAPNASVGIVVRLGLWPNLGRAWYWAYLVGDGRPLLAVRHHEVPLPRGAVLEVRAEGLWSAMHCETPLEHWSVGLEAFAVALDHPGEAFRGERGQLVPLGLDLEWEVDGPTLVPGPDRYDQPCMVHGDVLVGRESLTVDVPGHRSHGWGRGSGWASSWCRAAGRLHDGATFAAIGDVVALAPAGGPGTAVPFEAAAERDSDGFARTAELRLGALPVDATARHHVGVLLDDPVAGGRVTASLCRLTGAGDRSGVAWVAWHDPAGVRPGAPPGGRRG